ncbi:polymorphic outer membrane protein middle domain-containing protein [Chlamydia crocodili]|uniref:Autotransporter domain-containing protein n=1 Tax=Chlamydia crocodili TaxID=2766982 RepID=A0ABX8CCS9_9CHLA|nr:polymorphic outer membrane protein middle domain-containing protein [Chlamydia crocodili]QVE48830.1 autotransporter domain-containing protein [Chlamydia crocodili]
MKLSVYGFLLSSSLLSTHIAFAENASVSPAVPQNVPAAGASKTITELTEGFDGSVNPPKEFTSKATSNAAGTTYSLTTDISFTNITTLTPTPPPQPASGSKTNEGSCFSNTAGDLTFSGATHSLTFENISLTAKGAAISNTASGTTLQLTNLTNLTFSNSPGSSVSTGKGAIYCEGSSLKVINNGNVTFSNNHSEENGGAICYKAATVSPPVSPPPQPQPQPQPSPITTVTTPPTTIALPNTPILSSSTAPTQPPGGSGSPGSPSGPAPAPDVPGSGAQQAAQNTFTFGGNDSLTFSGNSSDKCGGAIYAHDLIITATGQTLFTNNTAKEKGGAIAIADGGTIYLSAEGGDIIFEGNTAKDNTPNAIDLGSTAKFGDLCALKGRSIIFYDPITSNGTDVSDKLIINGPVTQPAPSRGGSSTPTVRSAAAVQPVPRLYEGTIVFSGKKQNTSKTKALTNASSLKQPVELAAGTLVLEDGALFSAKSFSQKDTTSTVVLEQNTQLQVSDSIDLKNLWIGVTNVNSPDFARVSTTGSTGTVKVTGAITLAVSDPKFYENPDLAKQLNKEFIKISAQGSVTITDSPNTPNQDISSHLGYQGVWQLTWADVPSGGSGQPTEKVATLGWQPQGYLPTPGDTQSYTSLVPNSLWGMVSDVAAIQRLIEGEANSAQGKDIWGAGLSNFLKGKKTDKNRKFRNFSSGYAVGTSSQSLHGFKFSFGFCQLFGRAKDYAGARIHEKILSGSLYTQYDTELLPILKFLAGTSVFRPKILKQITDDFPVTFQAQFGYFYGDNSMKIKYLDATQTNSSWENHCYSGDIGTSIAIPIQSKDGIIQMASPFVKVQSVYVYQKGFHEKGLRRRAFDHTYLTNISIPLGLKVYGDSVSKDLHYELSAAYVGDAYRHNPKNTTTPIVTNVVATPWITTATNLQRHAARFQGAGDYALTSYIQLFAQGSIELRKSARSYHANAGSSIHF